MTVVIRKCVPRPAANPRSDGRKLFLEADVSLAMDQAGLDELRTLAISGRDFHFVAGEPPKREVEREAREVEFLREESKTFRMYRESAERELERLRARLAESERRRLLLQQEVVRREQSEFSLLEIPPLPGSKAKMSDEDLRKALWKTISEYWDIANLDSIQSIQKVIYENSIDPPKQQEPAHEKIGDRFRSIEFDEDEEK